MSEHQSRQVVCEKMLVQRSLLLVAVVFLLAGNGEPWNSFCFGNISTLLESLFLCSCSCIASILVLASDTKPARQRFSSYSEECPVIESVDFLKYIFLLFGGW